MNMSKYVRITKGTKDFGKLIKAEDVYQVINGDYGKDYYTSIFYYDENHFKKFKETNSVKGIEDVKTNKLVFDLDSPKDLQAARIEAIELLARLRKFNVEPDDVEIYFSGMKGFTLVVQLDREITPQQAAKIAIEKLGQGLETLDTGVYNASRILRVPNTKHQQSGLYKIRLTKDDLENLTIDTIKERAAENQSSTDAPVNPKPSEDLYDLTMLANKTKKVDVSGELNMTTKPKQWTNCKWSLLQGNFQAGERDQAMMILAATCRGLGYDKESTYYLCKSALKKSWAKYGEGGFTKDELWDKIIHQVFSDGWNPHPGAYNCKKDPWLSEYCKSLGKNRCHTEEEVQGPSLPRDVMWNRFIEYAENFEKNQILVGLPSFDDNVVLSTSALFGLLGHPGGGKTSLALQFLKAASNRNIPSMFFSMDMGDRIVCAKLIQNETGMPYKQAMDLVKTNRKKAMEIIDLVNPKFKNVAMNFQSGMTVEDIREAVIQQNIDNGAGQEVKFVVIDYLECIVTQFSDSTASGGFIANKLKDIANELNICILLLLQTQKHSTPDVSDPLLSLKGVKGSSLIEQSCSAIISLWREGYGPQYIDDDRYMSLATVKNRFGSLWKGNFSWDGVKAAISEMTEEQMIEFNDFLKRKDDMKRKAVLASNQDWS